MPTDLEKELLALAAAERVANTSRLYTAAATTEKLRAAITAEGLQVPTIISAPGIPENMVVAIQPGLDQDFLGRFRNVSMGVASSKSTPPEISIEDLSQLFMGVEARAQLGLRNVMGLDWGADSTDETVAFDIEFDREVEGSTTPNEAVRFQVGRDSPPSVSMTRDLIPTGVRVVSTRGDDGRFRPLTASSVAPAGVQPERSSHTPQRLSNPSPRASGGQDKVRPTALERLVGKSPFDDD